jgi:hypothetical protein
MVLEYFCYALPFRRYGLGLLHNHSFSNFPSLKSPIRLKSFSFTPHTSSLFHPGSTNSLRFVAGKNCYKKGEKSQALESADLEKLTKLIGICAMSGAVVPFLNLKWLRRCLMNKEYYRNYYRTHKEQFPASGG